VQTNNIPHPSSSKPNICVFGENFPDSILNLTCIVQSTWEEGLLRKIRGKQNQTSPNAHYGLKPLWVQRNGVGVRKSQLLRRIRGCNKIAENLGSCIGLGLKMRAST